MKQETLLICAKQLEAATATEWPALLVAWSTAAKMCRKNEKYMADLLERAGCRGQADALQRCATDLEKAVLRLGVMQQGLVQQPKFIQKLTAFGGKLKAAFGPQ